MLLLALALSSALAAAAPAAKPSTGERPAIETRTPTTISKAPTPGKERWPVKLLAPFEGLAYGAQPEGVGLEELPACPSDVVDGGAIFGPVYPDGGSARCRSKRDLDALTWNRIALAFFMRLPSAKGVGHNDARFQSERMSAEVWYYVVGPVEGARATVGGYLRLAALEPDGDFHLQLSEGPADTAVAVVEIPSPYFIRDAGYRKKIQAARDNIIQILSKDNPKVWADKEPASAGTVLKRPPKVCVSGALFYDDAHAGKDGAVEPRGKKGMVAPSLWELHPVDTVWLDNDPSRSGCDEGPGWSGYP